MIIQSGLLIPMGCFQTDVVKNEDGTFTVFDAKADGDKNIYVQDSNGRLKW